MLQNFTWKAFETTGSIDAYLLYREINQIKNGDLHTQDEAMKKSELFESQ